MEDWAALQARKLRRAATPGPVADGQPTALGGVAPVYAQSDIGESNLETGTGVLMQGATIDGALITNSDISYSVIQGLQLGVPTLLAHGGSCYTWPAATHREIRFNSGVRPYGIMPPANVAGRLGTSLIDPSTIKLKVWGKIHNNATSTSTIWPRIVIVSESTFNLDYGYLPQVYLGPPSLLGEFDLGAESIAANGQYVINGRILTSLDLFQADIGGNIIIAWLTLSSSQALTNTTVFLQLAWSL